MKKEGVDRFEYRGGYALISESELLAVLSAYKKGEIRKDQLRVWAARHESGALHVKSKVTLERILNCKSSQDGIKRLRSGLIKKAEERIDTVLEGSRESSSRRRAVARGVLRSIAQGRISCTETMVCLMYAARRIGQRKPLKRLLSNERYARFTYRELAELSGVPKANLSRAVASLKEKGLLSTVWIVKQNENQFGLLFVDGAILTLIPGAAKDRSHTERQKTTTPPRQNDNTPVIVLPTLRKIDPKIDIQKSKVCDGRGKGPFNSEFERIKARARAIEASLIEQVA